MKIGIDARNIYQLESGDGRYTVSIVNHLAEIDRENEYVILVRPGKEGLFKINNPNFRFKIVDVPAYSVSEQLMVPWIIRKEKFGVLHSFCFSTPLFLGCPSIITIYDIIFLHFPQFYSLCKSWLSRLLITLCAHQARMVLTISQHSRVDILSNFSGIPSDKIKVIYCGHGPEFRPIDKGRASGYIRSRYGIGGDFLLYVGNMNYHKNITTLIRVFKSCLDDGLRLKLVICGKKKLSFPELRGLIDALGLTGDVYFIDDADDETEVMLYNAAKVFIFLSLYEGFGMPPIEAMACGTPVIASDRSSIPEILRDAALFVNPEDAEQIKGAIKSVLSDSLLCARLQEKGLRQSAVYNWGESAAALLGLYREFGYASEPRGKDIVRPEAVKEHIVFSSPPKASIVIPSFDGFREGNLARLIADLEAQSLRDFEIHVIKGVSPQGKAINLGVEKAKGRYIIIMDDDTRIGSPHVVKNLVEALERDSSIGIAGASILVSPDANWLQKRAGKEFPRFGMKVLDKNAESDMACHGCCAISKAVFEEMGGERENIVRGLDPDLRFRMRQKGYKTVLVANTWVYHPLPATLRKFARTFFRNGMGSAHCQVYQPGLIYETDEMQELKDFIPRRPWFYRIVRFPFRLLSALLHLRFLRFLGYASYFLGYLYGLIKYSLQRYANRDHHAP